MFGTPATPAFSFAGATGGLFGAQTPATQQSSAFSFSTGASFGAFGAQSTPAFGVQSSPSLFGAQNAPSLFGAQSSASIFGAQSAPAFGTPPALGFGNQPQQLQQQSLVTKDGKPLTHATAWDDIHTEGQKYLLELECVLISISDSFD